MQSFDDARLADFFERYHRHTLAADLAPIPEEVQRAEVRSHVQLAAARPVGEVRVRVFTPTAAQDGWAGSHSLIQVVMDDMPFVVDSLTSALAGSTRGLVRVAHPILYVKRDQSGQLIEAADEGDGIAESWCQFVVHRLLTPAAHLELKARIEATLADVIQVNHDWRPMQDHATKLANYWRQQSLPTAAEAADFLDWITSNHLTFLGYQHYRVARGRLSVDAESGLGLLRGNSDAAQQLAQLNLDAVSATAGPLVLAKAPVRSTVHRRVYPEYLGVREFDAQGQMIGEHRFLGLLSRDAYSDSVLRIPIARQTTQAVLDASGWHEGSHSYKDVLQFLETFPRDVILQVTPEWLTSTSSVALSNLARRGTQAFLHTDPTGRFADVLVYVPRDIYNTAMRQRIQAVLAAELGASEIEPSVQISEATLARLHFSVKLPAGTDQITSKWMHLVERIDAATRAWGDDFANLVLATSESDERADSFLQKWGGAFDDVYRAAYTVAEAVADAECAATGDALALRIVPGAAGEPHRLRLFSPGTPRKLSELLPILSAYGFDVADEQPFELTPVGMPSIWLHDLGFTAEAELDAAAIRRVDTALKDALAGDCEIDDLLRLVLTAGLTGREVAVLRTYAGFVSQWGVFTVSQVQSALIENPRLAALLIAEFHAQLQPDGPASVADQLLAGIDAVKSLDHDRVLRAMASAVAATLRTNYFQFVDGKPRSTIALKFRGEAIPQLPAPRPYAEIWVESPRVRGVHLRFGAVARGGLRWSDRKDDLRTEIMGLVRAQVVKNAVIVPTGAKGGFFPKRLPDSSNREAWMAAGIAAYQEFINALLDVTDNRVGDAIEAPAQTVRKDGDDPYLVVAADKGTATFSDIANAISLERGFWLGDAFASGGSVGYDHKAMGITARGAWESVRHHFELVGIDPDRDPITAVGIGDMSGDVFGNGMLLSKSMRLVAAFDHRHIFLDPNPDSDKAWAERQRLFKLPRSSWADYDAGLISAGGGVFARSEKRITVGVEAAAALAIEAGEMSPSELMTAILTAKVDLLWNGGIGTYVKASTQSHLEVGDKANDAIRVNANELRCRVVGEGGNLGITQAGRIEAALAGVAINTDAIDNSAGVDTSDHEVNLKILLAQRPSDRLPTEQRNQLLASLTDDVAKLVLADNVAQNETLAVAASHGSAMASVHSRMLDDWQQLGVIDRKLETLPGRSELRARVAAGRGLTRPELSVLLAHAKLTLSDALLAGTAIDEPWAERFLFEYFPERLRAEFRAEILRHPLRREIVATVVSNLIINRGGTTVVWRAMEETGASADEVARALMLAYDIGNLQREFDEIEALGSTAWPLRITLLKELRRYIDRVARWLIANRGSSAALLRDLPKFCQATLVVSGMLPQHLTGHELARWQAQSAGYQQTGAPAGLADRVAGALDAYAALDLVELAAHRAGDIADWSASYFAISDHLGGDMLLSAISRLPRDDRWQTMARAALRADMYAVLAAVTEKVIAGHADLAVDQRIAAWLSSQDAGVSRVKTLLGEIGERDQVDIAAISVALRTLRELVSQTAAA